MKLTKCTTLIALATLMGTSVASAGALVDPIVEPIIIVEEASSSSSAGLLIPLLLVLLLGAAIAANRTGIDEF